MSMFGNRGTSSANSNSNTTTKRTNRTNRTNSGIPRSMLGWLLALSFLVVGCNGQRQYFRFTGTMDLRPVSLNAPITADAIAFWEDLTQNFYVDALTLPDLVPSLDDPQVKVVLLFASRPDSTSGDSVLAMQYQATASFISDSTDYDPADLALPAFQDQVAAVQYIWDLRGSGYTCFTNLTSLSLSISSSTAIAAPPTAAPTLPPVALTSPPTKAPTRAPTGSPTKRPSFSLTAAPVVAPPPTSSPTSSPTRPPVPEGSPTSEPTVSVVVDTPTSSPTRALTTKYATTQLVLKNTPGSIMEGSVLSEWTLRTANYLTAYIQGIDSSLVDSDLSITAVSQELSGAYRQRMLRVLEGNATGLVVEYASRIRLPSSYDANSLVDGAFATRTRRDNYRAALLDTTENSILSDFFDSQLVDVLIVADGDSDDNTNGVQEPVNNGGGGSNMGLLVGCAVGGILVISLIAFMVYRRAIQNINDLKSSIGSNNANDDRDYGVHNKRSSPTSTTNTSPKGGQKNPALNSNGISWEPAEQPTRLNQEIVVDQSMDDVSTIGDPLWGQHHSTQDTDDHTATTSVMQTETYNALLGRQRPSDDMARNRSFSEDTTEFSAFTGMSKYLKPQDQGRPNMVASNLLGELGLQSQSLDDTSFEQRMFPMDTEEERSLDFSYPTAMMGE